MGISLTEPGLIPFADTRREVETARELGVRMATHTGCVWSLPTGLDQFAAHGLLGPDIVHVHCNTCSAREWELLRASDAKISTSPETEIQMGMGHPPIARALGLGLTLSLSCDVMSGNSGDMFSQMRMGLQFARCMENDVLNAQRDDPRTLAFSARDALGWATHRRRDGARPRGPDRVAHARQAGRRDRRRARRRPAEHDRAGEPRRRRRLAGERVERARRARRRPRRQARRRARRRRRAAVRHMLEGSCEGILGRVLAAGPLLPEPRPSFGDLAGPLLANFNV